MDLVHSPFAFYIFPSTILCRQTDFQHKILNFAVHLYYQLSYKHLLQYNMLLVNALEII
jgi:hypothetical protein